MQPWHVAPTMRVLELLAYESLSAPSWPRRSALIRELPGACSRRPRGVITNEECEDNEITHQSFTLETELAGRSMDDLSGFALQCTATARRGGDATPSDVGARTSMV
jgi:hypothetical protein